MEDRSYSEYVSSQSRHNPCLRNLSHFLANDVGKNPCRISCLEFSSSDKTLYTQDVDIENIRTLLNALNSNKDATSTLNLLPGRILIVEDLCREIIEVLGSGLDIDPLFFASHIDSPYKKVSTPLPSTSILPSELNGQNFLSLQYQTVVEFQNNPAPLRRLSTISNVPRKLMILPPTNNAYIGLAQHSCSVLLIDTRASAWLGIILVDPPLTNRFLSEGKDVTLQSRLFQGGYECFLERPSYTNTGMFDPRRSSVLEDLTFYWTKKQPPTFISQNPTLLSLAYYPLKIAAAEWVRYTEVMGHSIKTYEYSTETLMESQGLMKLDSDLKALQVWGRRCMSTLCKLKTVIRHVKARTKQVPHSNEYDLIVADYEYIAFLVETYGTRLEAMVPLVASLVQIVDSRRSLREAANVTRLTNLALLFVPLSFVSGLFSMNGEITASGLALYFSVAVPLCATVFFVARLPHVRINEIAERLRQLRKYLTVNREI